MVQKGKIGGNYGKHTENSYGGLTDLKIWKIQIAK